MGKYFKIQMNIFQLQMWKSFRFRNEMSCYWNLVGFLKLQGNGEENLEKWGGSINAILHENASKPHQCKVKEQTCATNAKKLRTSKSCLQHTSQTKTKKLLPLHLNRMHICSGNLERDFTEDILRKTLKWKTSKHFTSACN